MATFARPVRERAGPEPVWPPTALPEGADLSVPAVLAILIGAYLAILFAFAAAARGTLPFLAPYGSAGDFVTRQLVVPSAIVVGIAVGLVLMLRWHRVTGLTVLGRASAWGTVPLGVFGVAAALLMAVPGVSSRGGGVLGLVLVGLFLAALAEEILFRGFLLHGLTRRLGGREAVLLGSALFSAGHVPSLLVADIETSDIAISLVMIFGLGILLCRIRVATGSIWYATGVHTLWNFVTVAAVGSGSSEDAVPLTIGGLKLVTIVIGLKLAVGVARSPRFGLVIPQVPAAAFGGGPVLTGPGFRPYSPVAPSAPVPNPWAVRAPATPPLPPPPPPARPDS